MRRPYGVAYSAFRAHRTKSTEQLILRLNDGGGPTNQKQEAAPIVHCAEQLSGRFRLPSAGCVNLYSRLSGT